MRKLWNLGHLVAILAAITMLIGRKIVAAVFAVTLTTIRIASAIYLAVVAWIGRRSVRVVLLATFIWAFGMGMISIMLFAKGVASPFVSAAVPMLGVCPSVWVSVIRMTQYDEQRMGHR